jgi:hypothetical protein
MRFDYLHYEFADEASDTITVSRLTRLSREAHPSKTFLEKERGSSLAANAAH